MKRYITLDDVIDLVHKFKQRGFSFLWSKINISGVKRTEYTFDQLNYKSADWWIIPRVRERWNELITGDKNTDYKEYFVKNYLQGRNNLRLISLGSGASHLKLN